MTTIQDHAKYTIASTTDGALLFDWKSAPGITATDFAEGITEFATLCERHQPRRAVIDARLLDPESQAVNWLRAQQEVDGLDAYQTWWEREIVPLYNAASIDALTVATGDPNAPGPIPTPDAAEFAVGYFTDVETALNWQPGQA